MTVFFKDKNGLGLFFISFTIFFVLNIVFISKRKRARKSWERKLIKIVYYLPMPVIVIFPSFKRFNLSFIFFRYVCLSKEISLRTLVFVITDHDGIEYVHSLIYWLFDSGTEYRLEQTRSE